MSRLGPTGLTQLLTDIKNWVLSKIPTKTSQLTNDSNFLTSHQSLSNYSTLANTVKSISISGKTITVTPGSGSAYTLTTQDTNTDTLVTQNVSTTNSTYPILLCATANATANQGAKTSIFGSGVKVNPSTSTITATTFSGALTGNVTGNCSGSSGSCTGNAATATKATGNANGKELTNTIIKGLSISGKTITYTQIDGTTGTLTTQDTNTDTLMTQNVSTTNNKYPILLCPTAEATANQGAKTGIFGANALINPSTGEIISKSNGTGAFRVVGGNYGFFIRNDGSNTYFLLTASGDQYGSWTSARPLTINDSTGVCSINGNAATATQFSANKNVTLTGYVNGTASSKAGWSIATALKNCYFHTGGTVTNTYFKVASGTLTGGWNRYETLIRFVETTGNASCTLRIYMQLDGSALLDAGNVTVMDSVNFGIGSFNVVYKNDTDKTLFEIYFQLTPKNHQVNALVLYETERKLVNSCDVLTMYNDSAPVASLPSDYTLITAEFEKYCGDLVPAGNNKNLGSTDAKWSNVYATTFTGALTGNVTGNVSGSSGSCTGNAATATQFSANKSVTLTGDVTGTASSKAGWSVATTLANSGVTAGSYGPTADVTGNNNATISVPQITVDAKGRVTSVVNRTLTCKNNTYNVYNKTLTIQKNGTNVATFTSNSNTDVTANITVPTKTSELTNDSGFLTSHQSLSNYVTLNGTQTISGVKTISAKNVKYTASVTRGTAPSAAVYKQPADYVDSAGNRIFLLETVYNTDKSSKTGLYAYNTTAATGNSIGNISIGCDASGNVYTQAPTPATADNSTKIATTAFVKAQGYITGSGNTTGSSGSCTGNAATASKVVATVANDNTGALVQGTMGSNDCFRIAIGGANNAGWAEIATGDDYNEPIYVRQYQGSFTTLKRTATLLDASGNTSFPGTVTATGFSGPLTGNVTGNCSGSSGSCTGNANTAYNIAGSNYNVVKGTNPSSQQWITSWIKFEKTGTAVANRLSEYRACVNTDGSVDNELVSWCFASGSTGAAVLGVKCKADGSGYAYCPTPATSDNSTKIATTAFVKAQGYLTSHQSLSNYVTLNGAQTISAVKTFTAWPRIQGTGYPALELKNTAHQVGETPANGSWAFGEVLMKDKDNYSSGLMSLYYSTDKTLYLRIQARNKFTNGVPTIGGTEVGSCIDIGVTNTAVRYIFWNSYVNNNVVPLSNATNNLGDTSHKWNTVYAQEYHAYNANAFMANQGGYTFLIRNDGGSTYFLMSAKNGNEGTWSDARPLTIANATGICSINGNAATATKATGNANGKELTNTIIKGLSISGKTITYTQIDGNTGTLTTQDTVYTHPTTAGNKHIPSGGSANQYLKYSASGTAAWATIKTSELTNDSGYLTSHQSLSNYVTLNSAQTISGTKTFSAIQYFNEYKLVVKATNQTVGTTPSSNKWNGMVFQDTAGTSTFTIENGHMKNGSTQLNLGCTPNISGAAKETFLQYYCGTTEGVSVLNILTASATAPTPATSDNSTKIATTAFVKAQGYLTSHQSLSNYSTLANTVKSLSISGKTITVTPGSGSAYTLTTQDTVYTHPTTSGNKHIPSGGSSGQFLGWDSDGTAKWVNNPNTNTDTLMTQNVSTTDATYPVLLVATANATANQGAKTGIFAKSVKVNPKTNVISASGFSGNLTGNVTGNCSGTSANVTGTVAIANGGTGATTRLNAVKALTNENVGTAATYFLGITNSWGKAGYISVADARTVLGIPTFDFQKFVWDHTINLSTMASSSEWEQITGGYKYTANVSLKAGQLTWIYVYLTTSNDLIKITISNGYILSGKNCVDGGKNSIKADTTTYGSVLTQTVCGVSRLNCLFYPYNSTVTLTMTYTILAHDGGENPTLSGKVLIKQ